jgi:hypothetical protein
MQNFLKSKTLQFQPVDSIATFEGIFGFVWKRLEIFDLGGHNLGTILFLIEKSLIPSPQQKSYCKKNSMLSNVML